MHPFVTAFMVMWFVIVAVVSLGVINTLAVSWNDALGILPGLFFAALMGVFGVGLVKFGRWLARDELNRILAFLEEVIDAESVG
jgi:hypothetical protein